MTDEMTKLHTSPQVLVHISAQEEREIKDPASKALAFAKDFKITTAEQYTQAGGWLKEVKRRQKALAEKKQGLLKPLKEAVKAVNELFAGPERELDDAENIYKRELIAFDEAQEAARAEEQRRRDEEARKERERLEREARERDEAAARSREAGRTTVAARQEAKAEELRAAADQTVPVVVQKEQPKVAGLARRENWYAVVTNFEDLILGVAAGIMRRRKLLIAELPADVPITALQANMTFLNNQAKAMKRELAYPGVKPAVDKVLASGSK